MLEAESESLKYDEKKGIFDLFAEGQSIMSDLHAVGEMVKESKGFLTLLKALPSVLLEAIIKSSGEITTAKVEQQLILSKVDINDKAWWRDYPGTVAHAGFKPRYEC